jgi:choice-of-anchor A domain-containing protein
MAATTSSVSVTNSKLTVVFSSKRRVLYFFLFSFPFGGGADLIERSPIRKPGNSRKLQVVRISAATLKSARSIELQNFSFRTSMLIINVDGTAGYFQDFNMPNLDAVSAQ